MQMSISLWCKYKYGYFTHQTKNGDSDPKTWTSTNSEPITEFATSELIPLHIKKVVLPRRLLH